MKSSTADRLSVVIPTLDAGPGLRECLGALAAGGDLVGEILIADGGSRDAGLEEAASAGAKIIAAPRGRGQQLARGADAARGEWLLFLHADTRLGEGWADRVKRFIADPAHASRAGYLRFRLADDHPAARRIERLVAWRCTALGLPYGDQGLLIARRFYRELGGYRPMPIMEDVDLVRRIGKARLVPLACDTVTSAARYRRDGYVRRPLRNLACLALYFLGVSPRRLARLYG